MNLFDSPFYILGAVPQDNRHKIAALAEEKALFSDAERVSEARSVLTTPSKRLSAEIRWFPGLNAEEISEVAAYCTKLQHGEHTEEPEPVDKCTLTALNIKLYAFPLKPFTDLFQIKYALLEISRLFAGIDAETIRGEINRDRVASGFPEIQSIAELEDELTRFRGEIRQDIASRLTTLPQQEYVELVTLLAEK